MRPVDLCVSTMTLARSEEEVRLLKVSLASLTQLKLPVFVADGGSPPALIDFIAALPGVTLTRPVRGLVAQVRASLAAAHACGRKFILYTEPDKLGFFERGLPAFLRDAPCGPRVGAVVACRDLEALATYPPTQRLTEDAINQLTSAAVGQRGDYSYGPFLLNPLLLEELARVPESIGWGWRHFLFAAARRLGLRVVLAPGPFPCPPEQRGEDQADRVHRLRQLAQNLEGLWLSDGPRP